MPDFPIVETGQGVSRQVLSHSPELMVVAFQFEQGSQGALHHHVHVQSSYVASGRFTFTIGEHSHDLCAGQSVIIPSNVLHGCVCVEKGVLIDGFTPRRDDFL